MTIKAAPADQKKVIKVFAFIGFQKVVRVAAAAVAGALVLFSSVNRASKEEKAKKWLRW